MIKTLTTLVTLLLLFSCGTKQVEETVTTTWNENDLNGKVKAVATYFFTDTTLISEGLNAAELKITERFDENGKLLETVYSIDSDIQKHISYSYNNNGDPTVVTSNNSKWGGKEDSETITTTYTYNDKGLNTKIEEAYSNINTTFVIIEKEYNEQGLLIHTFKDERDTQTSYTYDKNNRLSEETRLYDRIVYEYDNNGKLVGCKTYENGSNSLLITETFVYDSKGRLTKESTRDAEGSSSVLNRDIVMSYDNENRLVERKLISIDNDEETLASHTTYTYNEKGNMVKQKTDLPQRYVSQYTYDELGNWVDAQHTSEEETVTVKRTIEYY